MARMEINLSAVVPSLPQFLFFGHPLFKNSKKKNYTEC